jgi:hypothetical protein
MGDKDSQLDFDVIGFAKKIMSEVDGIRSFKKTSDDKTESQDQTYAESRLNAFFRLVGLPMFVELKVKNEKNADAKAKGFAGEKVLTPGFSRTVSPKLNSLYNINNSLQVTHAQDAQFREIALVNMENAIGTQIIDDRMLAALKLPIPLCPNFIGELGGKKTRSVWKQLKPLVTTYLTDGVLPKRNELARPFLSEKNDDNVDSDTVLAKPFIETVIRIRLVEAGGGGNAANKQKNSDFQNSIKVGLGKDKNGAYIFDRVFSRYKKAFSETNIRETFILTKLLGALQILAKKWVKTKSRGVRLISEIESDIVIKTTSAKASPFGRRASVSTTLTDDSKLSKQIKRESEKIAVEESYLSLLTSDDVAKSSSNTPKTSANRNISTSALNQPFIDIINNDLTQYKKNLSNLDKKKKKKAAELDKLRIELDMMTGEFSGLSVPDIIITMAALFLIDDKDLIGLLDKKTIGEINKDVVLKKALQLVGDPSNTALAVTNLGKVVDDLYTLLGININIATDRKNKTSTNSRANRRAARMTKRSADYSE